MLYILFIEFSTSPVVIRPGSVGASTPVPQPRCHGLLGQVSQTLRRDALGARRRSANRHACLARNGADLGVETDNNMFGGLYYVYSDSDSGPDSQYPQK